MNDSKKADRLQEIAPSFLQFIGGFAVQTLVHLGKMSNPMTGETALDLPNAKYSIDILAILQEKTKGNLSDEEDSYLSNLVRDLRFEYVATVGGEKAKSPGGETTAEDGTRAAEEAEGEGD